MRSLLLLLLVIGIGAGGCGGTEVPVVPDTGSLPFGLMIPTNYPYADYEYHAVSGVTTRLVATKVGDSIVETPQTLFYAQFTQSPGIAPLKSVLLNTVELDHHMKGDTLRLGRSPGSSIYGDNTWTLIDSADTKSSYVMPKIDIVDTVMPFDSRNTVRGDIPLTVTWKRPTLGSSAFYIHWKAPNYTYEKVTADYPGSFEIPQQEMNKLRGKGQVVVTRYYYLPQKFKNRPLMVARIAQRRFDVDVL